MQMDHSEALRLQAAEKYVLGELPAQVRSEYEDHYFECHECAIDLATTASFVEGSRSVFRAEGPARTKVARFTLGIDRTFAWLRPAFAIPILALLILLAGFQNVITIPHLKSAASSAMKVQDGDFISLVGADTRAEGMRLFRIHRDRAAILEIDIPRVNEFASYVCDLQDEAGQSLYRQRVPAHEAKASVHFIVPRGELQPGKYALIISSEGPTDSDAVSRTEISRLSFTIELVP
jgi:hypothetical protein